MGGSDVGGLVDGSAPGDREAVGRTVKPFDRHGVTYYDPALILSELAVTGKRHQRPTSVHLLSTNGRV